VAGKSEGEAQVVATEPAWLTFEARDGRIDRNALPGTRTGANGPRRLVAEHKRSLEPSVTDAALAEPMEVRAADPDGGDADQSLASGRTGDRRVHDAQVAHAVQ
jgi:hypothetical protein